jgi:hypothetical protein
LVRDFGESFGISDGEVSEHFTVDLDAGLVKTVDELSVFESVEAGGSVYTNDPEPSKVTFAVTAVDGGVAECVNHGFMCDFDVGSSLTSVALGEREDFLVALSGLYTVTSPGHGMVLSGNGDRGGCRCVELVGCYA